MCSVSPRFPDPGPEQTEHRQRAGRQARPNGYGWQAPRAGWRRSVCLPCPASGASDAVTETVACAAAASTVLPRSALYSTAPADSCQAGHAPGVDSTRDASSWWQHEDLLEAQEVDIGREQDFAEQRVASLRTHLGEHANGYALGISTAESR